VTANESGAPAITVQQDSIEPAGALGLWNIGWCVENDGADPIQLLTVRLPHGQFKSEEHRFEPNTELASGERTWFHVTVRCLEPEGVVTENAFLIFDVLWLRETWRIFVRIRVVVNSKREPQTAVELITTQKVGFSGLAP
jgi:hypothetical protein